MFSSIRTVMVVMLSSVLLCVSVCMLWLTVSKHEALMLESHREYVFALARNLSEELTPLLVNDYRNDEAIDAVLLQLAPYRNVIQTTVFDEQGQTITRYLGLQGRKVESQVPASVISAIGTKPGSMFIDERLYVVERIGDHAFPRGYVLVAVALQQSLEESRREMVFKVIPWMSLLLFFTILLSFALLKQTFRPLDAVNRFAQRVTESKNYGSRLPVKGTAEIRRLSLLVNKLMHTIEEELSINKQQNKALVEQQVTMAHLANYDSLTGLPNRQFVMDTIKLELARARRAGNDMMLLFFDLDGFKGINDALGHEIGDVILVEVANRVKAILRNSDILARLGGDEFLIVPDRDVTELNMTTVSERVLSAFIDPFKVNGLSLKLGVSIGVAKAKEANYKLSQLISNADLAMYRSKASGKGVFTIFSPAMSQSHNRKILIANSIDSAIENDQFSLVYQPKVNSQGMQLGFEALIRWQHPELGNIFPDEFIVVAEQAGKISAITQWVVRQACKELQYITAKFSNPIRVAINLSVHDLRHSGLFDWIYSAFHEYKVNPQNIEFEVTESAYLDNFESSERLFKRLHNLGCSVALDDFGTGYSSLSYLTQITIDTLKIDRQFVSQIETSERCRLVTVSIIDLAKRLNLKICAEGVETINQWDYLTGHGCDMIQGYLFSKPVPYASISTTISNLSMLMPRVSEARLPD